MEILDRLRAHSTEKFIPLQASLELTNRCNERCTHCYLETFQDDKNRLNTREDWFQILQQLRDAGTLYIILMGGEAMLSKDFWPVLERASDMGFHVSTITNGLKISSLEVAQRLKAAGLKVATISLYSVDDKIHDKMTNVKGSCEKTKRAIEFCKQAGINVGVNCLLTKENVYSVFDVEDWCLKKNVELKIDPNVTAKLNGDLSPTRLRASKEQIKWFYKERLKKWPRSRPRHNGDIGSSYICNSAKGKCAVTPYGDLLACIEIRNSLGNLKQQSFEQAWNSEEANKWRHFKVDDLKNHKKNLYGFCDHCPGMSKNEFNNPLKVSDFSYQVAQIKHDVGISEG